MNDRMNLPFLSEYYVADISFSLSLSHVHTHTLFFTLIPYNTICPSSVSLDLPKKRASLFPCCITAVSFAFCFRRKRACDLLAYVESGNAWGSWYITVFLWLFMHRQLEKKLCEFINEIGKRFKWLRVRFCYAFIITM